LKATFGLQPGRQQSALAGMSMGGYGTVVLAARHPQQYGFGYALAGAYPDELIAELSRGPLLSTALVLRCGLEDELLSGNRKLVAALKRHGDSVDYREAPGGHDFHYWSMQMVEMLKAVDGQFRQPRR
jgi:enterochelin esterase family protein